MIRAGFGLTQAKYIFLLLTVLNLWAAPAIAKPNDRLQQVEQELIRQKEQQSQLDAKAQEASSTLEDLRQKLINATAALQDKETESEALAGKMNGLLDDIAAKKTALARERHSLNDLLMALLALSHVPPQALFLQTRLTGDYIHRAILLRAVLPRVQAQVASIGQDIAALNALQRQLGEQQRLVAAAGENLRNQQYSLDQLIKTRQGHLQRTDQQRAAIARQLVSLSDEAQDLRQLLARVTPKANQKNRQTQQPGLDHTVLRQPVAGSLVRGYGVKDNDGVTSDGFTFNGLSGAPIVAPRAGKVVFAGSFRGFGKIVILQHDNGYHSFLAGFGRIDADMGQEVAAGEPLGVLPVKPGSKPELYFEWRHNNEPVNPGGGFVLSKSP